MGKWQDLARPEQLPPEDPWSIWLIMAGRGFGKTRTGAETLRMLIERGEVKHIGLIGQTLHEAMSVMVDGLLNAYERPPLFLRSRRCIFWGNGARAMVFGGDRVESLRGFQFDCVWIDEFAKFKKADELWTQVSMCLRLGQNPKCIITTTPRPIKMLHELVRDPDVMVTRGSTFDNAKNLSPQFIKRIKQVYAHTKIGAQEIYGTLLEAQQGELWRQDFFIHKKPECDLVRVVVAIDPAVTCGKDSCETGLIVAGKDALGFGYILDDLSGKYSPQHWIGKAIEAFYAFKADRIIAEVNNGGDLVEHMLRAQDARIAFRAVHASRGKVVRAEPVAALYEQRRIYHARFFEQLEAQLIAYTPGRSCDRMDALVWACHDLFLRQQAAPCNISVF